MLKLVSKNSIFYGLSNDIFIVSLRVHLLRILEPRKVIKKWSVLKSGPLEFPSWNMGSEDINGDSRAKIETCGVKMGNSGAKIGGSETQIGAFEPQLLA